MGILSIDVGAVNEAWDKLLGLVGVRPSNSFRLGDFLKAPNSTSAAMSLYVETTGSDLNDGSVSKPFRTIQAAVDSVPKTIRHPVTINVGVGTFDGFQLPLYRMSPESLAIGAYINVLGTHVDVEISGTVSSYVNGTANTTTFGSITLSGAAWGIDSLKGKLVTITGGTGYATTPSTNSHFILSNTADTLTIVGAFSTSLGVDTTFSIQDLGTVLNSNVPTAAAGWGVSLSTQYAAIIVVGTESGDRSAYPYSVQLRNFSIPSTTHSALRVVNPSSFGMTAYVIKCANTPLVIDFATAWGRHAFSKWWVEATASVRFQLYSAQSVTMSRTFYSSPGFFLDSYSGGGTVSVTDSHIQGCTGAYALGGRISFTGCRFVSHKFLLTGATLQKGAWPLQLLIKSCSANNCATFLEVKGPLVQVLMDAVTGAGNTTVINATNGANVYFSSTVSAAGTTEVSVDGVATDYATIKAATPKYAFNATTGTRVWSD